MTPTPPQDWRNRLPKINEISRDTGKLQIRARYWHAATGTCFYVAQGDRVVDDFWLYWGFAVVPGRCNFPIQATVSSHDLEAGVWLGGVPCKLDSQFAPGQWLQIKNAHFPPPAPIRSGRTKVQPNAQ